MAFVTNVCKTIKSLCTYIIILFHCFPDPVNKISEIKNISSINIENSVRTVYQDSIGITCFSLSILNCKSESKGYHFFNSEIFIACCIVHTFTCYSKKFLRPICEIAKSSLKCWLVMPSSSSFTHLKLFKYFHFP